AGAGQGELFTFEGTPAGCRVSPETVVRLWFAGSERGGFKRLDLRECPDVTWRDLHLDMCWMLAAGCAPETVLLAGVSPDEALSIRDEEHCRLMRVVDSAIYPTSSVSRSLTKVEAPLYLEEYLDEEREEVFQFLITGVPDCGKALWITGLTIATFATITDRDAFVSKLVECLTHPYSILTSLELSGGTNLCGFENSSQSLRDYETGHLRSLAEALGQNSRLTALDLSGSALYGWQPDTDTMLSLVYPLRESDEVGALCLRGVEALADALGRHPTLRSVRLCNNNLGGCIRRSLYPHGSDLSAAALDEAMRLKMIHLLGYEWTLCGCAGFRPTLTISRWDAGPARAIAAGLALSGSLRTADLLGNDLREAGAAVALAALGASDTLTSLCGIPPGAARADLSGRMLDPGDAALLAGELRCNSSLTAVNLLGNRLGKAGVAAVVAAFEARAALRTLCGLEAGCRELRLQHSVDPWDLRMVAADIRRGRQGGCAEALSAIEIEDLADLETRTKYNGGGPRPATEDEVEELAKELSSAMAEAPERWEAFNGIPLRGLRSGSIKDLEGVTNLGGVGVMVLARWMATEVPPGLRSASLVGVRVNAVAARAVIDAARLFDPPVRLCGRWMEQRTRAGLLSPAALTGPEALLIAHDLSLGEGRGCPLGLLGSGIDTEGAAALIEAAESCTDYQMALCGALVEQARVEMPEAVAAGGLRVQDMMLLAHDLKTLHLPPRAAVTLDLSRCPRHGEFQVEGFAMLVDVLAANQSGLTALNLASNRIGAAPLMLTRAAVPMSDVRMLAPQPVTGQMQQLCLFEGVRWSVDARNANSTLDLRRASPCRLEPLIDLVACCTELRELDLSGELPSPQAAAAALCPALRAWRVLLGACSSATGGNLLCQMGKGGRGRYVGTDMRRLAEALGRNTGLRRLSLARNAFGGKLEFCQGSRRNEVLTDTSRDDAAQVIACLCRSLAQHSSLESLDLSSNALGPVSAALLARGWPAFHPGLHSLNLLNNEFGRAGAEAISAAFLGGPTVQTVCGLTPGARSLDLPGMHPQWDLLLLAAELCRAGAGTADLRSLRLRIDCSPCRNDSAYGIAAVVEALALPHCQVADLDLSGTYLGPKEAELLASALTSHAGGGFLASLTRLNLLGCSLEEDGRARVIEALRRNDSVTSMCGLQPGCTDLDLSHPKRTRGPSDSELHLGLGDVVLLVEEFRGAAPPLTALNLSGNPLGPAAARVLAAALTANGGSLAALTALHLSDTRLAGVAEVPLKDVTPQVSGAALSAGSRGIYQGAEVRVLRLKSHIVYDFVTETDTSETTVKFEELSGLEALMDAVAGSAKLAILNVLRNDLEEEARASVAGAARRSDTLTSVCGILPDMVELDLSEQELTPEDAALLAEELRGNAALTDLNLSGNMLCGIPYLSRDIEESDEEAIADYNSWLIEDMYEQEAEQAGKWNELYDETGIVALLDVLLANTTLTAVNVKDNRFRYWDHTERTGQAIPTSLIF
ncbi:hypothetical protein CYMTET_43966, partial [Cymbomonas tetramitiformis]